MNGIQAALAALTDDDFEAAFAEIMRAARELGLEGFGGGCFAAAVGVNRAVFAGAGTLVAGLNVALWEGPSHALGHAAVMARGSHWDADGRAKEQEEIESWGMLDPGDSDFAETFASHGLEWGEDTASEAAAYEFDGEQEFLAVTGCAGAADKAERIVAETADAWFAAWNPRPRGA